MSDLIKREDAIEAIKPILRDILTDNANAFKAMCIPHILTGVPSADRPMLDDGTLVVSVDDATKVTRVLVEDSEKNGDLYYADRPKGEWKPFDLTWGRSIWYCTACEESTEVPCDIWEHKPIYKYCPNCGADMRGEEDES